MALSVVPSDTPPQQADSAIEVEQTLSVSGLSYTNVTCGSSEMIVADLKSQIMGQLGQVVDQVATDQMSQTISDIVAKQMAVLITQIKLEHDIKLK